MISTDGIPYDDYRNGSIFALNCPEGWADSLWELIDASRGKITLVPVSAIYDGYEHKPVISELTVNDSRIDAENYITIYGDGDYVSVGDYGVSVLFKSDYSGSPTNIFSILPRSIEGGNIVMVDGHGVETNKIMYQRGLAQPTLKVKIDGMSDEVVSADFNVRWLDAAGRWPRPGEYVVEAVPKASRAANYTGPAITNRLTVLVNPELLYTEYATEALAISQFATKPKTADGMQIVTELRFLQNWR